MANEILRNILWQLNRAYHYDTLLSDIPEQKYYAQGSKYFQIIEIRNTALNDAVHIANKAYGLSISSVRIHQRDVKKAKLALSFLIRKICAKQAVA